MMKHSIRLIRLSFVLFALCCFVASSAFADTNVTIAVIYDFEPNHKRERAQRYIDELSALVESEFDLTFIYYRLIGSIKTRRWTWCWRWGSRQTS